MSAISKWKIEYSGTGIISNWELVGAKNNGSALRMWSGQYDRDFPGSLASPDFTAVTGVQLNVGSEGTMTFTDLYFVAPVVTASVPGVEKNIESLNRKYYQNEEWKTGSVSCTFGNGIGTPYGDGSSLQDEYIELSSFKELRLYVSSGDVRAFFVKEDGFKTSEDGFILTKEGIKKNGQWGGVQDTDHKLVKNGDYYYITVADIKAACGGQAKLIGIKAEYGQTVDISKIVVVEESEYDYIISGAGIFSSSVSVNSILSFTVSPSCT